MGRKDSLPEDAPAPRLCDLVKWPHFQGYGFNLHSEKGRDGQFVGKIDAGSPAEACGLLEGDQIIEVNGVNTSNENHKQVVERIKADPARVSLLVVDPKTAEYYKKRSVVVKGSLASVKHLKTAQPAGQDQETGESETSSQGGKAETVEKSAEKETNGTKDVSPSIDTSLQVESGSDRTQPSPAPSAGSTGTVESAKSAESGSAAAESDKFGLKLNMTAAEMKEYLKTKKRHDPRNDNLSFKRRHEIVQNM